VDLVVAGRALHWFDPAPSRAEFGRILRPGGWLAVLLTPTTDAYLNAQMERLRTRQAGWHEERTKHHLTDERLRFFFGGGDYRTMTVPAWAHETWEQFIGRLTSLSPAPVPGEPGYATFERVARGIFDGGAVDGRLRVAYATVGHLKAIH
jgi:hypothetical protein